MKLAAELKKILHVGETSNKHAGRVLVLDGADVVGHRVVELLIDAEYTDLRVGIRTLHKEEETRGVDLVPFVWEDEDTYAAALKDAKTVFVTLPIKPSNWDEHFPRFLKACTTNHVTRIVKLSFFHAIRSKAEHKDQRYGNPDYVASHYGFHDVPMVHKHALCDGDLILHRELNVTILNASHLMSNIFRYGFERKALKDKHEFYGASDGKGVNYCSPNDVAEVAVKAILDKTNKRQAYKLTGPAAITDEKIAALLTEQFGTKITYVEKPLDFFDKDKATLESIKATGFEENFPKGDIKKVLGRDAETFADYLKATDRMSPIENEAFHIHVDHAGLGDKGVEKEDEEKKSKQPTVTKEKESDEIEQPTETADVTPEKEKEKEGIEPTETEVEVVEKKVHGDDVVNPEQAAQPMTESQ